MVRSFNQMLRDYQAQSLGGATIEQVAAHLIAEQASFEQASNILARVYGIGFVEASQYVKALRKQDVRYDAPELVTRFLDDYQSLPEKEIPIEAVIVRLHEQGLSVGDAVKILRKLYSIPLSEAKMLLFEHPAWQKEREFSDRMLELMFSQDFHMDENY